MMSDESRVFFLSFFFSSSRKTKNKNSPGTSACPGARSRRRPRECTRRLSRARKPAGAILSLLLLLLFRLLRRRLHLLPLPPPRSPSLRRPTAGSPSRPPPSRPEPPARGTSAAPECSSPRLRAPPPAGTEGTARRRSAARAGLRPSPGPPTAAGLSRAACGSRAGAGGRRAWPWSRGGREGGSSRRRRSRGGCLGVFFLVGKGRR